MTKIFVSYRREDSQYQTGRICDQLILRFGRDNIFYDVDAIPVGVNWRKYIEEKVQQCDILIAPIGDRWLSLLKERANNERDMMRFEIEVALRRGIPIIPLEVADAGIPSGNELPASIKILADYNGMPIRPGRDFHQDIQRLFEAIKQLAITQPSDDEADDQAVDEPSRPVSPPSTSEWVVSKKEFAETTADFWASGALNFINPNYLNAYNTDGRKELVRQIQGMADFFEKHNLPYFKNEVHVSGNETQTCRGTTYRLILTMPDRSVRVFPLKDIFSYSFKGTEGTLRGYLLGSVLRLEGTFGTVELSGQNLENLQFPIESVVQGLRTLASWKSLPLHVLDMLGKTRKDLSG